MVKIEILGLFKTTDYQWNKYSIVWVAIVFFAAGCASVENPALESSSEIPSKEFEKPLGAWYCFSEGVTHLGERLAYPGHEMWRFTEDQLSVEYPTSPRGNSGIAVGLHEISMLESTIEFSEYAAAVEYALDHDTLNVKVNDRMLRFIRMSSLVQPDSLGGGHLVGKSFCVHTSSSEAIAEIEFEGAGGSEGQYTWSTGDRAFEGNWKLYNFDQGSVMLKLDNPLLSELALRSLEPGTLTFNALNPDFRFLRMVEGDLGCW